VLGAGKRASILRAAAKAFARLGFKKASIDDIARAAGVAKGTVYLACESKADLFYQAILRDIRDWISDGAKMVDPRVAADELLVRCAVAAIKFLRAHPLVSDLIAGIYHGELPGWEARFEELRALGHANIVEILKLGIRQGRFRDDLDPELTASVLQDMMHAGYIFHRRAARLEDEELYARLRTALSLVVSGLLARSADR
jgi:AcrR family transcriptional regulator